MPTPKLLPFPILAPHLGACLRCGYPLDGLPAFGVCPECGLGYEDERTVLQISGVAKNSGGPVWRKIVWGVLIALAVVYSQLLGLIVFRYPWLALVIFGSLLTGTIAMVMTGSQRSRGSETFGFTPAGFARWTVGADPSTRVFTDWAGVQRVLILKRVGPVWARAKIVCFDEAGKRSVQIETGFRCPQEDLPVVEDLLTRLIKGESIGEAEGIEATVLLRDDEVEEYPRRHTS